MITGASCDVRSAYVLDIPLVGKHLIDVRKSRNKSKLIKY